ncbi:MAG: DNA-processing protein DprA [Candidatus Omnitrophota bacterium]
MTELDCLLSLNAINGLGPVRIRKLLDYFCCAKNVFSADFKDLISKNILPQAVAENLRSFPREEFLKMEYSLIQKHKVNVISFKDKNYPQQLLNLYDAPILLYVRGILKECFELALAIVGSRRASVYGTSMAQKLAMELSELGITIVSGMARGIDTAAHRGALCVRGSTVAVLGCGLSRAYPPENKKLMDEIAQKDGAVLSEFPMDEKPLACNFPRRNRIISGLSMGVVVVEASQKSGALITSDFALEQGKEVFAVPGKIDSPNSRGVHSLIKQGAKLVASVDDIIEELKPQFKDFLSQKKKPSDSSGASHQEAKLSDDEKQVFSCINSRAIQINELADQCRFSIARTMAVVLQLELKHLIKQLPGKLFVRI